MPALLQAACCSVDLLDPQCSLRGAVVSSVKRGLVPLPVPLCDERRAYALQYHANSTADGGRVFRCHVDDSDITLATCLGDPKKAWTGADLNYVERTPGQPLRPGTPDLCDPSVVVRQHTHTPGVGVLHGGECFHFVSPLEAGERATLVAQAMLDDGASWKRTFLTAH